MAALIARFNALPKRQQLAVLIVVPAVLVGLLGWMCRTQLGKLGPDPSLPTILHRHGPDNLWDQITTMNAQIAEKDEVIKRKADVEKTLAALKADIKDAEESLPGAAEKASMREVIERLAREIPSEIGVVQIKKVSINEEKIVSARDSGDGAAKPKNQYPSVTYTLELQADMNGLIKYIDALEKNPRFISVRSFQVKGGAVGEEKDKRKASFDLHAVRLELVTYIYSVDTKKRGGGA